jgi:glycosyltransferase involved in cell wall biosynthesis
VKILILTISLPGGGAEKAMRLLCEKLIDNEISSVIQPIYASEAKKTIGASSLDPLIKRRTRFRILQFLAAYFKLHKVVHSFKPTHIILNCAFPELLGCLLKHNAKVIVVEHSSQPWIGRETIGAFVRLILKAQSVSWVIVSDHFNLWKSATKNVVHIPNLVSLNHEMLQPSYTGTLKRIVFIGRLSHEKQPRIVIEAAARLNVPALIIGDGNLGNYLLGQARKLNVQAEFKGFSINPWNHILPGDIVIVPSKFEGDGLVVIESILQGLPIIVSNISAFRRLNLSKSLYFSDVDQLVEVLNLNRDNLGHFVVDRVKSQEILNQRDPDKIVLKWKQLLETIC